MAGPVTVAPEDVAMRVQDPLAAADWFQEGCHYVPELEEFLDAIGHYAASDADLIHARWGQPLCAKVLVACTAT